MGSCRHPEYGQSFHICNSRSSLVDNVVGQMGAMSDRLCEMSHSYQKLNGFGCPVENGIGSICILESFVNPAVVVGVHHGCCVHHGLGWICDLKVCVCSWLWTCLHRKWICHLWRLFLQANWMHSWEVCTFWASSLTCISKLRIALMNAPLHEVVFPVMNSIEAVAAFLIEVHAEIINGFISRTLTIAWVGLAVSSTRVTRTSTRWSASWDSMSIISMLSSHFFVDMERSEWRWAYAYWLRSSSLLSWLIPELKRK